MWTRYLPPVSSSLPLFLTHFGLNQNVYLFITVCGIRVDIDLVSYGVLVVRTDRVCRSGTSGEKGVSDGVVVTKEVRHVDPIESFSITERRVTHEVLGRSPSSPSRGASGEK